VHSWNKVRLTLSTHSERGLIEADHALARRIDEVARGWQRHRVRAGACYARRVALMPDDDASRSSGAPTRRNCSRA
jgi:hypothetical protein